MRTKGKINGVFKDKPIVLDLIGDNSILFDRAVSEIFSFKHDARASNAIIFIDNPDVGSLSVLSDAIPVLTQSNAVIRLLLRVISLRANQFNLVSIPDPSW